jgi:predicted nucleotidyltransferase
MLAERPLPDDLDARLGRLVQRFAADPQVAAAYLFGSRARAEAGPRSDVDLAVVLVEGDVDRFRKRLDLLDAATRELGTDAVDLVILEDAPTVLAHRVLAHGRLLLDQDPRRRTKVAFEVMRRYLDERWLHQVLDLGLARRVRENRLAR